MKVPPFLCVALGLATVGSTATRSEAGVFSRLLQGSGQRTGVVQQATYASPAPILQTAYNPQVVSAPTLAAPTQIFNPPLNQTEIEQNLQESARLERRGLIQQIQRGPQAPYPTQAPPAQAPAAPSKIAPAPQAAAPYAPSKIAPAPQAVAPYAPAKAVPQS